MAEIRNSGAARRAQRAPSRTRGRGPEIVLGLGLLLQLAYAVFFVRGMWFDLDAWGYLVEQPTISGVVDRLMDPHAGHWSTVTYLYYQLLFAIFGMHTYWPYVLTTILIHLLICLVTWWVLVRLGCTRWAATATAWVIIFMGAGAQGFLWDAAMPPALSVLLCLLALAVLIRQDDGTWVRVAAAVLILLSVMTSGAGVAGACLVGVFLLLQGRVRTALWVVVPSALAFVVWYFAYGHEDLANTPDFYVARLPEYVWTGLTSAFGEASGIPGAGAVLLIAIVATVLFAPRIPPALRNLGLAGTVAAVLHLVLTGISRMVFGIETASSSRYLYLVLVLMAPALAGCFVALSGLPHRLSKVTAVVAAATLLLFYTGTALAQQHDFTDKQRAYGGVWREWVVGTVQAHEDGERILTHNPSVALAGGIDVRQITADKYRDAVPQEKVSPQARLDAEGEFFVGVGPDSYDLFRPADITFTGGFAGKFKPASACNTYPALDLSPSLALDQGEAGNEIGVHSDSTQITTQLRRDGVLSSPRVWDVQPGDLHIASTAKGADLLVTFNRGGDITLCTN